MPPRSALAKRLRVAGAGAVPIARRRSPPPPASPPAAPKASRTKCGRCFAQFEGGTMRPPSNYSKLTFGSTRPGRLGGGRAGGWCGAQACGCGSNRYKPTHPPPKEDAPAEAGEPSRPTPERRWFARGKQDRRTNPRLMPQAQSFSIAQNA